MKTLVWKVLPAYCLMILLLPVFAFGAEEAAPQPPVQTETSELIDQVETLQLANELKLTDSQITFILSKIETLKKKRDDRISSEKAVLKGIDGQLTQMKNALVSGKEVPSSAEIIVSSKIVEMQKTRQKGWEEFQNMIYSCVRLLDKSQIRDISRSPEAISTAAQMVQQIRSASEENWSAVLEDLIGRILEVKKVDKAESWRAQEDKLQTLPEEARAKALEDLENQKNVEIGRMRVEIQDMLMSIRTADPRILSIGVNKIASSLRSEADVQAQLHAIMSRILDNPGSTSALKARLEATKASSPPKSK